MDISNATELSQADNAEVGDLLILQYTILSVFTKSQVAAIFSKLLDQPFIIQQYEIIEHNWLSSYLQVKIKVIENPIPIALIIVGIATAATSLFIYLSLDKIYKIASDPTGTGPVSKFSWALVLIAIAAVLFFVVKLVK